MDQLEKRVNRVAISWALGFFVLLGAASYGSLVSFDSAISDDEVFLLSDPGTEAAAVSPAQISDIPGVKPQAEPLLSDLR